MCAGRGTVLDVAALGLAVGPPAVGPLAVVAGRLPLGFELVAGLDEAQPASTSNAVSAAAAVAVQARDVPIVLILPGGWHR
jgi:hypothetical protein